MEDSASLPQPRSASWLWLLGLFAVAGLIETAFYGQMNAFVPHYLPKLGVGPGDLALWTGLMVIIPNAVGIPFIPLWGALADRYARQPIIIRSFVAHVVAAVFMVLAGNVWMFIVGRTFMTFALGNSGLMMTTLAERTPPKRLGLVFAVFNGASPVGAFLGPLVGGRVADAYGFPALVEVMAVLMVFLILALSFGYRDSFHGTDRGSLFQMALEAVRLIWRSPRLRALFTALFVLFSGWTMGVIYVPLVIGQLYTGQNLDQTVGIVIGAAGLATLALSPIVGALADRYGHLKILFVFAVLEVLLWPLPGLTRDLTSFTAAWALLSGVASGVFSLSFSIMSSSAAAEARGRVMSFAYLPINIAFLIGPALGSQLARFSLFIMFPVAAGFTIVGIGLLALAVRQPAEVR